MLTFYRFFLVLWIRKWSTRLPVFHDFGFESGEHVVFPLVSIMDSRLDHMLTFCYCFLYFGFESGQHVDVFFVLPRFAIRECKNC